MRTVSSNYSIYSNNDKPSMLSLQIVGEQWCYKNYPNEQKTRFLLHTEEDKIPTFSTRAVIPHIAKYALLFLRKTTFQCR